MAVAVVVVGLAASVVTLAWAFIVFVNWFRKRAKAPAEVAGEDVVDLRDDAVVGDDDGEARTRAKRDRAELVEAVKTKLRSEGTDFPVRRAGHSPTIVTFDSGKRRPYYSSLERYKAAGRRGEHHGDASWSAPPKVLSSYTTAELREMLAKPASPVRD